MLRASAFAALLLLGLNAVFATPPAHIVGGAKEADAAAPEVIAAAHQAAFEYSRTVNSIHPYGLVDIAHATTQVVAGIKYGLDLHLAPALSCTHADAASPQALADCKLDSANPIAVHASVVHQPWMATKDAAKEWQVSFEK